MDRPRNTKDVRAFIGAVNHYKSLWPRSAHVLAPLAELTGRGKFVWIPQHDAVFKEMKAIITADAMNAFPNYSLPFEVYTDASDFQLGAAIIQQSSLLLTTAKNSLPLKRTIQLLRKSCWPLSLPSGTTGRC